MVDTYKEPGDIQTEQDNTDVKLAFDTIKAKRPKYNALYNYYEGYHPLHYSASRLKKVFERMDVYFSENWLAVIVDAVIDRLVLSGFDVSKNNVAKAKLDELWRDHNIHLIAEDVHESTTIVSEAFVIAMKVENDDDEEELEIYFNDARMCHMFYKANQPNKKRVAAKLYQDDDGYTRLTLYYEDRFEYYRSRKSYKMGTLCPSYKFLEPDPDMPEEENPFDKIPVFHWVTSQTTRKRDLGPSEISMQDAINKLVTDMMVSSEFNSFVQRVIISQSDPGNMPNESGTNWWLPASDTGQNTEVKELGGRDLKGYLEAIDKLATALAIISRTPKHYFFAQGGDPSGEALIALEAPLNKKVKKRQARYGIEWQAFAQFLLELEGVEIERNQLVPTWEPAETVQPKTQAEITKLDVDAGMPLTTSKRRQGWNNNDIKQLTDDLAKQKKEQSGLARQALDELRAEDARSNDTGAGDAITRDEQ